MDKKKLILLAVALVVAVGTALMARSMFAGSTAPQAEAAVAEPEGPRVLVAQLPILLRERANVTRMHGCIEGKAHNCPRHCIDAPKIA